MSKEKKEMNVDETIETVKSEEESAWVSDSSWVYVLLLMILFGGFGFSHDTTDHELRERVARLEGQMDIVGRRDK